MQTEGMIIWGENGYVAFNPDEKPIEELPFIYGYNTGELLDERYMLGKLIAQDGTTLGAHYSSTETFQRQDLAILPGCWPERQDDFQGHYPGGYRMEYVPAEERPGHVGLAEAIGRSV
ncbi:hypothetical protein D0Y60_01795 [Shinella sp. WSJ-2]|uniref:hypothetical protein n=1 Tax=Shinella sp. WSJ-2 TaxID=2303749 RepID=UPI000E3D5B0C|nr:hypothetical protein [Shinella sp. WSJ-2]RFZ89388.1 hypothetical protein D0Y60_01795 [Shinella sp. WSJ-2]